MRLGEETYKIDIEFWKPYHFPKVTLISASLEYLVGFTITVSLIYRMKPCKNFKIKKSRTHQE